MVNKIKLILKSIYFLSYITTILTLFIMTKNDDGVLKGDITPWVLGIITGLLGILIVVPFKKRMTPQHFEEYLLISTLALINLLMIVFSTLDIVGIKNYIVTAIIFIIAPPITIFSLFKLK